MPQAGIPCCLTQRLKKYGYANGEPDGYICETPVFELVPMLLNALF
ncbi:MAG: hypothetical protein II948_04335 [Synergistaceae bacterium]|nr:hypothetical protein [Synergistaceae bacterium]MBQ4419644.1 hypothetical protein [Synergistaceae bacterium]MBQ9581401.1 hypothetical protein [Synergistaceae bacterium]MBQ9895862.1 hypothetical protein [Synergistaceae bacterium]MBR0221672.1 hypothetical protein [Synergistaceae bacterium]